MVKIMFKHISKAIFPCSSNSLVVSRWNILENGIEWGILQLSSPVRKRVDDTHN